MPNYYCEYCGAKDSSVFSLTANSCHKHPNGTGKHKLYEGSDKTKYTCKFCGQTAGSIFSLTLNVCFRNNSGNEKHSPAL